MDADPLLAGFAARLLDLVRAGKLTLIVTSPRQPGWLPASSTMVLAGLAPEASTALLERHGVQVPDALQIALQTQTEGNPQLVLLAGAVLRDTADPDAILAQLPQTMPIEDFLLTRIDARLTDAERRVMGAIAVLLGFPATPELIAAVSGQRDLARLLRTLTARSVLSEQRNGPGRTYTQHTLVRAFYYQQLDRRELQGLHRRSAEYYTRERPDLLHATRHWLAAGDAAAAVQGLAGQVRDAINQSQAHALAQLLAELPSGSLDAEAAVALALAQAELAAWLGDGAAAQTHYTTALTRIAGLPPTPPVREQHARACYGMGRCLNTTRRTTRWNGSSAAWLSWTAHCQSKRQPCTSSRARST